MNLQEKIGQMLLVGFQGLTAPDYLLDWLAQGRVGGVILFSRNVESPQQLAALTESLHAAAKYPILISIDQEGGVVARLRTGFTESPGAMALSAAGDHELTTRMSSVLAAEMHALGINWNYGPVLDILYNPQNPALLTRSFGTDKEQVALMAAAAVEGFQHKGVAACAKHFPGLGTTALDTHLALPRLDTPVEALLNNDLLPYQALAHSGLASVMTTHTIYTALDTQYPATLSPVIIQTLLRERLAFDGVVTTDCMEMKAISDHYGAGESAVLAALAGVDIILFSHTRAMQEAAYDALLQAAQSGRLPLSTIDAANARIQTMKQRYAAQPKTDVSLIHSGGHLAVAEEAARAGMTLLSGTLPVDLSGEVVLIEFASLLESEVVESGGQTGFARIASAKISGISTHALKGSENALRELEYTLELASNCDVLLLATRNAYLQPRQLEHARDLIAHARKSVLLCLRSPYDAQHFSGAQSVLCTCGDATPSLEAAVDAVLGRFVPNGRLPISEGIL